MHIYLLISVNALVIEFSSSPNLKQKSHFGKFLFLIFKRNYIFVVCLVEKYIIYSSIIMLLFANNTGRKLINL